MRFSGFLRDLVRPWLRDGHHDTHSHEISRLSWPRPARTFVLLFVIVDLTGTGLLLLPVATAGTEQLTFVEALFTATTSLTVCGLTLTAIGSDLSAFGQIVVMVLVQTG